MSYERKDNSVLFHCEDNESVKLSIVTDDIIRVQVSSKGKFNESTMIKYGFVKDDFSTVDFQVKEGKDDYQILTSSVTVLVSKANFGLKVLDKKGNLIVRNNEKSGIQYGEENVLNFDMPSDEHFFGFGFMRETLDARGKKLTFKRAYRWNGATVPFFLSTRGYAFYSNSVFNHDFDFTNKTNGEAADYYSITTKGGSIDFYLIYGPSFPQILDKYTNLTGKTMMVPRWAFGLQYRLRYHGTQEDLLGVAKGFREKEIPCDIMALEPGWEEVSYAMDWKWSPTRFPTPKKMIDELSSMGYKMDLWESGIAPYVNMTDPKVRKKWYAKRKHIVDMGVRMFKQDDPYPRSIVSTQLHDPEFTRSEFKDKLMTPEELNNVSNSLYTQTLFKEFRKQTKERAIVMFHAYNASVASHRWPFQWAGDFQAANGLINASLSGHAMVSYDIRNPHPAGWHQGFFTPFTVVDSWAYYREPWLYSEAMEESHRLYACLRSRLVPYFYSSLWQSHTTALPIERPMVLNYSDDPNTYQMKSQFMVGDWFLVGLSDADDAPANEKVDFWTGVQKGNDGKVYLPKGRWVDYWNSNVIDIEKAQWVDASWPEYMGGSLYVKGGAIIPMGQVKNYIGETKDEIVVWDIYPHNSSSYQLYEDDGISYDYEKSKYALTDIECHENDSQVKINISKRKGFYKGMPEKRSFLLKIHTLSKPKTIIVDGEELAYFDNGNDLIYNMAKKGWYYDIKAKKVMVKLDTGWKYSLKSKDALQLATIPGTPKYDIIEWNATPEEKDREVIMQFYEKAMPIFSSNQEGLFADGFSQAKCEIKFADTSESIGKIDVELEGPVLFSNRKTKNTFEVQKEEVRFNLIARNNSGIAKVKVSGENIETRSFDFPIYGKPVELKVEKEESLWMADSLSTINVVAKLLDKHGSRVLNIFTPLTVELKGKGLFENGMKKDTIDFVEGRAAYSIQSTFDSGKVEIKSSYPNIPHKTITDSSEKGTMQVKMNPPTMPAKWVLNQVSVFVDFKIGNEVIRSATNEVTLNVYHKKGKLLDTYIQNAKNGGAVFKDISFYKRPAECVFEIKCKGFETVKLNVFDKQEPSY
ncbi:glycoside hydrolase family 31 protein [Flavivirga amylovorans]|uniref:Glycoside hydrolase family 31 protein n=1 Tax=Flavivirga amylovorans TaxID=870486 RepID=A0ABT8WXY6_9FLAO|nr:TIM-barrel domain-containing protein [Flavivirga amylovorans]MDO5986553.1 glycoside hydrolase family 31 protein [Flavivirga amylovorans]